MHTASDGLTSSDDLLTHYQRDGFALLGQVLDLSEIAAIRAEEQRFRPAPLRNDQDALGARTLFRSQVCAYSPVIRAVATNGRHLAAVTRLIGADVALLYTQFVTKLPDADVIRGEFPWHQDLGYVAILPLERVVTVWVALDDVDEVNGCVWVQPGSHRNGLLSHQRHSEASWHLTVPVAGDGVPARLKAGEAIAFTGLTLHRSKANASASPRRGFFFEYVPVDAIVQATGRPILESGDTWVVRGSLPLDWRPSPRQQP